MIAQFSMTAHLAASSWGFRPWINTLFSGSTPIVYHSTGGVFPRANNLDHEVEWSICGQGLQCANISVPLDYQNLSDERTFTIAVNRVVATDEANRKGAVFFNPGGPGASGIGFIEATGALMSEVLQGQYDIVGFDPRGVSHTRPYVSCFDSLLQEFAFFNKYNFALNLPASASALDSDKVKEDLSKQIALFNASIYSLSQQCLKHTGEVIGYLGTEAVVRDIDFMSQKIYGQDEPINYWGTSYGTNIGQYMVKILPAKRLGKILIDGIANVEKWSDVATSSIEMGFDDTDKVFDAFASNCIQVGQECRLNSVYTFNSSADLVSKVDSAIDSLYSIPVPGYNLGQPIVANAALLRSVIFSGTYFSSLWSLLASVLGEVMQGNVTTILSLTTQPVNDQLAGLPDRSIFAQNVIFCTDAKPFISEHPAPSLSQLTDLILSSLRTYSRRSADQAWSLSLCAAWNEAGLYPRKTRYNGTFELANDTLSTPALIVSNTLDPITPLKDAHLAAKRFGDNSRLIQQVNGIGHTSFSQASYCTGRIVNAYFVNGTVPSKDLTVCEVDQKPFVLFNASLASSAVDRAWGQLAQTVQGLS